MITRTHAILLGALALLAGCGKLPKPDASHPLRQQFALQVDTTTRARADSMNAEGIKELRFTGTQFMRFGDDPIVIKDKTEINAYITALRHSECQGDVGPLKAIRVANGIDQLQVDFLPRKGQEMDSQIFFFNLVSDVDCFGPEFRRKALDLQQRITRKDELARAARTPASPAGTKAALAISNINDNQLLSEEFLVNVSTHNNYQYGDVTLKIDGRVVAWGGSTLTPTGPDLVQFSLCTENFFTGTHTLTVQDNLGNTDTRRVNFHNDVENIEVDPIFDVTPGMTDVPSLCKISCRFEKAQPWTVRIQTTEENPVTIRTYSGNSTHVSVAWNGKDRAGHELPNDVYEVVITCPLQTIKRGVNKDSLGNR